MQKFLASPTKTANGPALTGWLTICDAQGRSFFKQKIQPGSPPELAIDTKNWPSGSFVATVSTTRGVRAKPLVKVK